MASVRLSAEARRDLKDIRDRGIEAFGADATAGYMIGFGRLFRLLRDQPFAGQARPEFELDIRSLSDRPYRILYRVRTDEAVVIARILHQARDVQQALLEQ